MRKLIAYEYVTLDGVMEAPEQWQFPYVSDDVAEAIKRQILEAGGILLGRITYQIFAASWPSRTNNEFGVADKLNSALKFVVSRTLEKADWNNSTLIKANVANEVANLKQQSGGDIAVIGSGHLLETLMGNHLIDEYRLMVHPLVLGSGKRLFADGIQASLQLVEAKQFTSGVLLLRYHPHNAE